jgi:hypothetical protein
MKSIKASGESSRTILWGYLSSYMPVNSTCLGSIGELFCCLRLRGMDRNLRILIQVGADVLVWSLWPYRNATDLAASLASRRGLDHSKVKITEFEGIESRGRG